MDRNHYEYKAEYSDFAMYANKLEIDADVLIRSFDDGEWENGTIVAIARSDEEGYDQKSDEILYGKTGYDFTGEFDDDKHACFVYVGANRKDKPERIKITSEKKVDVSLLFRRLSEHCGHHVEITGYLDKDGTGCYSLECFDCNEVLFDTDTYDLCGKDGD